MRSRFRRHLCALALAGTALATAACGTSSDPPPDATAPASPDSATLEPRASDGPQGSRILNWLRMGPNGEGTPLWYDPLKDGNCGDEQLLASRAQPIPGAGAILCEAAVTNDEELWRQGEEALAAAPPPSSCWEEETVAALQRLIEFHDQDPDAVPDLRVPAGTACPLVLESLVSPLAPGVEGLEIPVSTCGGAPVFLQGNIEWVPPEGIRAVSVGTTEVPVQEGNGSIFFRAPASDVAGHVPVTVSDADWPVSGQGYLVYRVPTLPCPTPPPSAAPTPSS